MAKGRLQETQELLERIARCNGMECSLRAEDLLEPEEKQEEQEKDKSAGELLENQKQAEEREAAGGEVMAEKKLSILDLFGSWRMAGRTCTVWAIWFIGSLGYYVFSLGSVNLGGNQYINLFLAGRWGSVCVCVCVCVHVFLHCPQLSGQN